MRKVVSFDLDGTLMHGPFSRVLIDLGRELADGDDDRGAEITASLLREHERLLVTDPTAAYDWESLAQNCARTLGRSLPFDVTERLQEHATSGEARTINGTTRELLVELADAGWQPVALTNGWLKFQAPTLSALGLLDVFDDVVTSERVGHAKPSPEMFRAARGDAERYAHVGDRHDHDIVGGNAAGALTILLRPDVPVVGSTELDRSAVDRYMRSLAEAEAAPAGDLAPLDRLSPERPTFMARELGDVVRILVEDATAP